MNRESPEEPVRLDGRYGEGGGQLLRTALSLAACSGVDVHLDHIRADRPRPGMAPQHLTAVDAAAAICGASVEGDVLRSQRLVFEPAHPVQAGDYRFDVEDRAPDGSAGSISLVLQTVLVPLSLAEGTSRITVRGGTHVAWSPSFDYLRDVYATTLNERGYGIGLTLRDWGFYPAGGGRVDARVTGRGPSWRARSLRRTGRDPLERLEGFSAVGNLPHHVLERQRHRAEDLLQQQGLEVTLGERTPFSRGPGSVLHLHADYGGAPAGFTGYGRRGKPAETVAEEAVDAFLTHHRTSRPVDRHLADQLLLPLLLADGPSLFGTSGLSDHLRTNARVLEKLGAGTIQLRENGDGTGRVHVHPGGFPRGV